MPFIQDDLGILEKHFRVRRQIGHGFKSVARIFTQVPRSDLVFCWFASVYAFVAVLAAKVLGIPSVVVVGGVDVAKDRDLGYGIWLSPWKAPLVRFVFRRADVILVVDQSLRKEAIRQARYNGRNIKCLPTGYDSQFWKPLGEKEPAVLTVAAVRDFRTLRVKGLDTLIEAARLLPDVPFVVVGADPQLTLELRPPLNIRFFPFIPRRDILPLYRQAKVYCQPSRWEGLPNALCEAMLCGCIPVASAVGGNPGAVAGAGFLVPPGDPTALAAALQEALAKPLEEGYKARSRIVALLPFERRERGLLEAVRGCLE